MRRYGRRPTFRGRRARPAVSWQCSAAGWNPAGLVGITPLPLYVDLVDAEPLAATTTPDIDRFRVERVRGHIYLENVASAGNGDILMAIIVRDVIAGIPTTPDAGLQAAGPNADAESSWLWFAFAALGPAVASQALASCVVPVDVRVKRILRPHQRLSLECRTAANSNLSANASFRLRTLISRVV